MDMHIEFHKNLCPGKCNFEVRKFKANLLNFLLLFEVSKNSAISDFVIGLKCYKDFMCCYQADSYPKKHM